MCGSQNLTLQTLEGRLIVVSYSERGEKIRIISGREATRKEQGEYENK